MPSGAQSTKPKRFFLPQASKKEFESAYQSIVESVKDQFRWDITDRRIFRLDYIHDKKHYAAEVGEIEQLQGKYEILAILESNSYMIFTRTPKGSMGVTILVDKDEVQEVRDFS